MQIYFSSRDKARQAKRNGLSNIIDNGVNAPKGKRYTLEVQATATNNNVHNMACPISGRQIPVFVRGRKYGIGYELGLGGMGYTGFID